MTNLWNNTSPQWRGWLSPKHRCLVLLTAYREPDRVEGKSVPAWFAPR